MFLPLAALCCSLVGASPAVPAARAQDPRPPGRTPLLHHRRRQKRARRARPDTSRTVQSQVGFDGAFAAPDARQDESATLSLIVTADPRLEFEADVDVWAFRSSPGAAALNGRGDSRLLVQAVALTHRSLDLVVAAAYELKVPTASPRGLGTGRVDHRVLLPVSLTVGPWEVDATQGFDAVGVPHGLSWGVDAAVGVTRALHRRVGLQLEWSGQTVDTDRPAGQCLSGGVTWQVTRTLAVDAGARVGLTRRAPRYGVSAGLTAALQGR